ncbi:MAG: hypothetical protein MUD09_06175 [Desulfobacterales bacterium]|nr:hypothetical protein [Desulfobacterales bacterium]
MRGTFTFATGEKSLLNLVYRRLLTLYISKSYITTDSFSSVAPVQNQARVKQILDRASRETVELEVHPENREEMEFLLSHEFGELLDLAQVGCFMDLSNERLLSR